jgi:hypothetical protein
VRHVRMLGLCLMALLAMAATTAVVASPALASCNEECKAQKEKEKQEAKEQKEREKEEAKAQKEKEKEEVKAQKLKEKEEAQEQKALETGVGDPWGRENYKAFQACPWELYEPGKSKEEQKSITDCFVGVTLGGKQGGFFEYGNIKVPLDKAIKLQGGFRGLGENVEVVPAKEGYETLEAPELPVEGGISVITPLIQEEAEWPQALKEGFQEALKNHETNMSVKIEMAGTECFTVPGCLDSENILYEEGVAFRLPLKVTVASPFLEKLGGGPCQIGSDENPIHVNLTSAEAGTAGSLNFSKDFNIIFLQNSRLVDTGWHIPKASGASGCGGPYESYVDEAINLALEVVSDGDYEESWKTGIVVLKGDLHDGSAGAVAKRGEKGEL